MTARKSPSLDATNNPYRELPSVSALLNEFRDAPLDPEILTTLIREEMDSARESIRRGAERPADQIAARVKETIGALESTRLDPAINGTGVILHTNLGRAPVSDSTARAMAEAAASYLSLELDPETNLRGGRMDEVSHLVRRLTGAEAALVVNNNAAAILLSLAALCAGREVIVSRGEAVEIGGGFRIPDVIEQSGCRLIDVGTTNRTRIDDYRRAFSERTAALLKVHASNFRIEGFTAGVSTAELSAVAQELRVPLIEDLGSGALLDTAMFGLKHEPTVGEAVAAGASVVTLSGDKLLGGPQAGIIAGQRDLLQVIERHPLARAVRADKVTLAGITTTLRHYIRGEAVREVPIWSMIGAPFDQLRERAGAVGAATGGTVIPTTASIGGGSLPGETLPSVAVAFATDHPDALAKALRVGRPRVFPVIRENAVLIDFRSVRPADDGLLIEAVATALGSSR